MTHTSVNVHDLAVSDVEIIHLNTGRVVLRLGDVEFYFPSHDQAGVIVLALLYKLCSREGRGLLNLASGAPQCP